MLRTLILVLALLLARFAAADMVAMDDSALGQVQGRQGIALDLQSALNANPVPSSVLPSALSTSGTTYGGALSSLSSCTGVPNPCYLAIQLEGRPNQWLTFKDSYLDMLVNNLQLNVGALVNDTTGSGYFNSNVFYNLATGPGTQASPAIQCALSACTTTVINGLHALQLSFHCPVPSTSTSTCQATTMPSYSSSTKDSTGYTDIQISESIGRAAVEFTTPGSGVNIITAPTDATDSNGSFIGLAMHDNNSNFAGIYVGGRSYVYGF